MLYTLGHIPVAIISVTVNVTALMAQYSRGNLVYTDFQFYLTFNTKSTESVSIIVGSGHLQQVYNAHPVMDAKNHLFPVSNNAEV